jgi:hypothetical protein
MTSYLTIFVILVVIVRMKVLVEIVPGSARRNTGRGSARVLR